MSTPPTLLTKIAIPTAYGSAIPRTTVGRALEHRRHTVGRSNRSNTLSLTALAGTRRFLPTPSHLQMPFLVSPILSVIEFFLMRDSIRSEQSSVKTQGIFLYADFLIL